ncbi:MAG: hypothetical protein DRP45_00630, partial [Candidatus Zixiibacteriota bacterium]
MGRLSIVALVILTIVISTPANGEAVYTLIKTGRLEEARDSLSQIATAASRDGTTLFCQSLLDPSADQAARLMEAALAASVSARCQEEIYYRLAQYYLLKKDYRQLSRVLADYSSRWETGRYHAEMLRLSVLLDELNGDYETALRQCDRYLISYSSKDAEQWGQIDKARIMKANSKSIGSLKTLRSLSRAKSGVGIAPALFLLGREAIEKKRVDDAVFYYNLLREAYPAAVGLDDLVDRLGGLSAGSSEDNAAEKLTGTYYSIKVGVFA